MQSKYFLKATTKAILVGGNIGGPKGQKEARRAADYMEVGARRAPKLLVADNDGKSKTH